MRSAIIGLAAGAALLQQQAELPDTPLLFATLLAAAMLLLYAGRVPSHYIRIPALASCGVAFGFAWAGLFAQYYLAEELPMEWEGQDVTVVGTVDSLPYYFEQGVRFNFAVERIINHGDEITALPSRLALSWYSAFRMDELQAVGKVEPGERWQLTVRLRRPHGNANPHGFDYEVWLLEQNLRATGYVRPDKTGAMKNKRLDTFVPGFANAVQRTRAWIRDRIHEALPAKEYAGVIVALVIGDQRAIPQSDWKVFNRTGVGHLISISGLHITMISGLFAGLVFALWRRSFFTAADLPLFLPAQKAAALAGAVMALLYVLLAGFGVPAQRTLYMLIVVAIALWIGRIASVSHVLLMALGVVVLLDPWCVLWPGFWLSFGAVGIILYATVGRAQTFSNSSSSGARRWTQAFRSAAYTQYVVTLGLVPLTMLLFAQVSLVSPVANAIAIPLISFLVTPSALLGSLLPAPFSGWLLGIAHQLIDWLTIVLNWLSEYPAAVWSAPAPAVWIFLAAMVGTLWLLAPSGWPVRWLGAVCLLPLVMNTPTRPEQGEIWITAFDVGQGTALLVETTHRRLLYDTGPAYSPEADGGNRVILPYLRARGITKLDGIVISHSDVDHSGGALSILEEVDVGWVSSSLPDTHRIVGLAPNHQRCVAGQTWSWDDMRFEFLHPTSASYESAKWKPNARSCTLKISAGTKSILLPGDIEAVQEAELVEMVPDQLRSTVLLAPHHGSGTSSTRPFLDAVRPEVAVFQVGYRNRYRHPKAEVFDRYGRLGIERIRTDDSGAVEMRLGKSFSISEYRHTHKRYWYGR